MSAVPVVFLPGFMCDARLFDAQTEMLTRKGIPSCVADLSTGASLAAMAASVLDMAPKRFCLAGLSMGGILAFEILRQAAHRVTHLLLMNTTPHADAAQARRQDQLTRVARGEFRTVITHDLKPNYFSPDSGTPERKALVLAMAVDLGPDVFVRQTLALMRRPSAEPVLAAIHCPTLILAGADDTVCPPRLHHDMAGKIAHAECFVLARCGHLSPLEAADAVGEHLLRLLEKPERLPGAGLREV